MGLINRGYKAENIPLQTTAAEDNNGVPSEKKHSLLPRGLLRGLPYTVIGALFLALLCTVACAGVLAASNGDEISHWSVQPSVILSVLSTVANIMVGWALAEGAVIAFWQKAARGASIYELQRTWAFGSSIVASVFAGRHTNMVAAACIFATLLQANGPLLQKASKTTQHTVKGNAPISARVSPFWPDDYYTGYASGRTGTPTFLSPYFAKVMKDFTSRTPITGHFSGCSRGSCDILIEAVGLIPECNVTETDFDYMDALRQAAKNTSVYDPAEYAMNLAFDVEFGSVLEVNDGMETSWINMTIFSSTARLEGEDACPGTRTLRQCSLRTGKMTYSATLSNNNTVALRAPDSSNGTYPATPVYVSDSTLWGVSISGVAFALTDSYTSSATFGWGGGVAWIIDTNGSLAQSYLKLYDDSWLNIDATCNLTFNDPTADLISNINEIMFRIAVDAADQPGMNATQIQSRTQNIVGLQTASLVVYESDYSYLAAVLALSVVSMGCVAATMYGWWWRPLGLDLGPIDIARSFNAPLIQDAVAGKGATAATGAEHPVPPADPDSPCTVDLKTLLGRIGHVRVRYGEDGFQTT